MIRRRDFISLLGASSALASPLRSRLVARLSFADTVANQEQESGTSAKLNPTPIAVHPKNPKYFLFRGKPLALVAATEHYGSVVNRRFNFDRYLAEAADKKQTLTRLFLLFRELQSARNPYSPLKPESPDYVAPWPRTGPEQAMDGEPVYDLDQWNGEYFGRLHRFLSRASDLGIVVELTVFSNTYADHIWALNPLRSKNNRQGIGNVDWPEYNSLRDKRLVERQEAYARKIVQEASAYDNVYYEICNEPGGGLPNHATPDEVDAWQDRIAHVLRDELRKLRRKHLVVGQNAFSYASNFSQNFDPSFSGNLLDAVNVHPLPNLHLAGRTYQLGNFMSKELQLIEFRDFFLATQPKPKPCISDEDNAASLYRDDLGWTIHRKRAWMAVMTGAHYDYIDFSIQVGMEAGTEESRRKIRLWMKHLSEFIHSFDFIHARPAPGWIEVKPPHVVEAVLAKTGEEYVAYLADGREIADPTAIEPLHGTLAFSLPAGRFRVCLYSPTGGLYSPSVPVEGGKRVAFDLAPFQDDIVLRVTCEKERQVVG